MNIEFDISSYLRLNPTDMLIVCISTFLIVLIAKHFFWDKALDYLKRREDAIQEDLNAAAQSKAEAQSMKVQYEQQISDARGEAHAILESAKSNASMEKKEVLHKARLEAEGLKEKAFADIEREKIQVRKQMKNEIADVAFLAAEKIVEKELDEDKHKKYVDDFIEHAGDDSWQL